ncbi:ATP-binding protein [Bdellovibrio sp. HCB209]|uniref:ATP-binding protein n=1 Tax=Bdellovibrio sp. HCB209 TaxID=3394354 RepID=UPI0039B63CD1
MKTMDKKKKYRKISEKITLTLAFWLLIITALATFLSYLHISSIVTSLVSENLEKYIEVRSDRESQVFRLATKNQQILAQRLEWQLKSGLPRSEDRFKQLFTKFPDGAIRERDEINNKIHPSYFLPDFTKLDAETIERSVIMYDFLDRECFLSTATFSDCWVADANGSLGVLLEEEVGYSSKIPGNFKNLDQVWMKGVSPQENPLRQPRWTKTYFDPAWQLWMITLSTPIYVNNKFTGVIGNDIFVGQMLDRIMKFKLKGTKNIVINSEGYMVAHPELEEKIKQSHALLKVSDLKDFDPYIEKIFSTASRELSFKSEDKGHIFDLGSENLYAVGKIEGPDWYLVTLYPKSLISTAAFNSAKYILIFGCLSLILELFLLMRLLQEKLGHPLKSLVTTVQRISSGDLEAKVSMKTRDEFEILGNAFNEMTYNLGVSRAESHAAMEKAIEAARVKSNFVASISHEMKTPLNGILGMTHFLNDTNLNEEQRKYAAFITESGSNLLAIVNQVLDVSKIDAKKMELSEGPFSLKKILDDVYNLHHFVAKQKGIPIDFENSVPEEAPFIGDADRIKQILNNLLSNALKFSDMGSISLTVSEVKRFDHTHRIRFVIKDQGIGISEEVQEKLFQPFTQADMSMTRQYGGTGLGLYIVKSFVTLMGGAVGVISTPGIGSEFWFEINLGIGAAPELAGVTPVPVVATPKVSLPILVVEDNFVNQVLTEALLKKLNYTSQVVKDGQEAVEAFEEGKYSLILMDCQMPMKDGFDATRDIRKKESAGSRIPIIALTANTENDNREICLEAGMDDMLSKPVKVAVFKEKLEYWLAQAQKDKPTV